MKKILFTLFRQPITTVILSLLIAFGGVIGALGMPMQLVPDMKIPIVSIVVTYPGASAAVIEESVTSVPADSMSGISGITGSFTYSYDNVGAVMLEFDFGTAVDEKLADVRERASALDLPDGCSSPEVSSLDFNGQATATIYVTSTEDSGSDVAYAAAEAEKLAGKFSAIDGVGSVETDGEPSHRVSITPLKGLESITLLLVEAAAN